MVTIPMLQSVMLFQNHQVTTPYMPQQGAGALAVENKKTQEEKKWPKTSIHRKAPQLPG